MPWYLAIKTWLSWLLNYPTETSMLCHGNVVVMLYLIEQAYVHFYNKMKCICSFFMSSHRNFRSPGRGNGFLATRRLSKWHMLSYDSTTSFSPPECCYHPHKHQQKTCAGPSDLHNIQICHINNYYCKKLCWIL